MKVVIIEDYHSSDTLLGKTMEVKSRIKYEETELQRNLRI